MSKTTAARRVALFTTSSLVAAGLSAATCLGLAMTPASALAADECGDPSANGPSADTFTCSSPPTYPTGVDYSATTNGDLTVILRNRFDTGAAATGGIRMFGDPGEDMTLQREDNPLGAGDPRIVNTSGRAIDLRAQGDGDVEIDLTDGDPASGESTSSSSGTAPIQITGSTDAIRAEAAGSGDVAITFAPTTPSGTFARITAGSAGGSGVVARTTTGDISIDARVSSVTTNSTNGIAAYDAVATNGGDVTVRTGSASGRLYGIRAAATGSGDLLIETPAVEPLGGIQTSSANSSAPIPGVVIAGIHATTGVGTLTINGVGEAAQGYGVYIDAGGDVNFTGIGMANGVNGQYGVYVEDVAAGTTTTLNLAGGMRNNGAHLYASGTLGAVRAAGAGELVINVQGVLGRIDSTQNTSFDLAGMSSAVAINFEDSVTWSIGAVETTMAGPAAGLTIDVSEGATLVVSEQVDLPTETTVDTTPQQIEAPGVVSFTGGEAVFANAGTILIGGREPSGYNGTDINYAHGFPRERHEGELRLEGLAEFRHSGRILLGGYYRQRTDVGTDGWHDDILSLPGATWVGEGGEILMDVNLDGTAQTHCNRDAEGDLQAADCVILTGGATEGVTYVTLTQVALGDRGAHVPDGIVLVDVSGGTGAQGDFVLSPSTQGYSSDAGGVMDVGVFAYGIAWDPETQQHKLVSIPSRAALQLPGMGHVAQSLWRTSTGIWFDRQVDMRAETGAESGGGVWLRLGGEVADRDLVQSIGAGGQTFTFDNSSTQTSYAVTGGLDLVSGAGADSAYVLGVMAGYNNAEVEYETNPNTAIIDGFTLGAYASYLAGGLFVDAAVNANKSILRYEAPAFNFFPNTTIVDTDLLTFGAQVEAGWRVPLTQSAFVEPLAGLAYVRSRFDDLDVPPADASRTGVTVAFDDLTSLRGSVGARLGVDQDYGSISVRYSVLGRLVNEFDGESAATLLNAGADALIADELSGDLAELGLGASVSGLEGAVSGFVNVGGAFGDDYQSTKASAGVRVHW